MDELPPDELPPDDEFDELDEPDEEEEDVDDCVRAVVPDPVAGACAATGSGAGLGFGLATALTPSAPYAAPELSDTGARRSVVAARSARVVEREAR
ncbi:hypothetical protein [Nostocoides australiense]|nr:hypothetical protein [Tetrasphaera australiensis]